jgi:Asp-tRNA(Asn)/Glu-tRNA(Gln) amidotransferase A subunit family amidase
MDRHKAEDLADKIFDMIDENRPRGVARNRITCLTAHGGLTGVPQVSIPGAAVDGLPVGLSIVGAHGKDAMLVAVAKAMEELA